MLFDYPQPLQVAQVTCLRSQIHKHLFEKKRVLKRISVLQEEGTVHQKKAEQPSQKKKNHVPEVLVKQYHWSLSLFR